ncbi:MAG: L-rhamnose catabolism isomerase [Pseudoruegeria sp.]
MISPTFIESHNARHTADLQADFDALGEQLDRRGVKIEQLVTDARAFGVAVPSWGTGTGGTRFARFPGPGEPATIFDKLDDCGVIHQLTQAAPSVSLHIPWDMAPPSDLKAKARQMGLTFDAVNSNTFQDAEDQPHSYKFGSLSHTSAPTRQQAVDHNLACIDFGDEVGSKALTVWIGDGSNFPGQTHMGRQFERYLDAMKEIYAGLPNEWRLFSEHKIYEPAFYSTVVQDWGTSLLTAQELGEKAMCLVDLGHHAPNVNIEMIVSRLIHAGKLGGFHFNDSKYGDDDLDSGTIDPFRLFLVWNELIDAETATPLNLSHMIDQSHNVTDPIESLMISCVEIQRAALQARLVDRVALAGYQVDNDALMASATLRAAFRTDVSPIMAMARLKDGGAINPIAAYRESRYRKQVAEVRPAITSSGGGIV